MLPPNPILLSGEEVHPTQSSALPELSPADFIRDELLAALSTSVPRAAEAAVVNPQVREMIRRPLSAPGSFNP